MNIASLVRGIAAEDREIMAALCDAVGRFAFLQEHSEYLAYPSGVVVSGDGDFNLYGLMFSHLSSGNALQISLNYICDPKGPYHVDVCFRRLNAEGFFGWSDSGHFSVGLFCDKNCLCFPHQIEAGGNFSEQIDSILHQASNVLKNQCEFALLDGTWVWLRGSSLRESMTHEAVEALLQREYATSLDFSDQTLFTRAIAAGRFDLIDRFVTRGIPPGRGWMVAAMQQRKLCRTDVPGLIDRLLAAGCDVDEDVDGYTPLAIAADLGDVAVVNHLLLFGAKQLKPTVNYERGAIHELLRRGLGPYWMS